jgi:hypothetical protein
MPLPVTAHVWTCFVKRPLNFSNCSPETNGAQSTLLITRTIGTEEPEDFYLQQESKKIIVSTIVNQGADSKVLKWKYVNSRREGGQYFFLGYWEDNS